MYTVIVAGGIASGKSTVARAMESHGARRLDLDNVSRSVLAAGSEALDAICAEFGTDLVDARTGELDRGLLAQRAFVSAERAAALEAIELPYIKAELARELAASAGECPAPEVCVVEVPLLDRIEDELSSYDEIVCVVTPYERRRELAVGRGMTVADFEARAQNQPSDAYLRAHATTVIANDGTLDELLATVDAWWQEREARGWGEAQ